MTTLVWIIGRGGLLGSALEREMGKCPSCRLFRPAGDPWTWADVRAVTARIDEATEAFARDNAGDQAPWRIFWAAGRGTMASAEPELAVETALLRHLLDCVAKTGLAETRGTILFASSAGAVYGARSTETVTEETPPDPPTAYGREKLKQEKILAAWADVHPAIRVILARFSNLYGPGQATAKKQGLITHIARAILRRRPVSIFVPFDTIRDYLYVDDAARRAVRLTGEAPSSPGAVVRIVASEESTTIAEIIGTFRRLTRLNPRIVRSVLAEGASYPRRVSFRSMLRPPADAARTPLPVGIARTLAHERTVLMRGSSPPPRRG